MFKQCFEASVGKDLKALKSRAALSNRPSRFLATSSEFDDGDEDGACGVPRTELLLDRAASIITRNRSPDVPFEQSINPYRGCEHGCIYCFARPSHAYWDLSPGLDFETKIFYKPDGPRLLEEALKKPGYRCQPIVLGTNTDPYQPIDRQLQLTRRLMEVLQKYRHPFSLITKGSHVLRDLDILEEMAKERLCSVTVSLTTLEKGLKTRLEPRAASPESRLDAIRKLSAAGVPTGILVAPVIPAINDAELEAILRAGAEAGALTAGYVFLRLPGEVKDLFYEWLHQHYPDRAAHVISLIRQSRGGADYDSDFGTRMRGSGIYADLIAKRFKMACARVGLNTDRRAELDCQPFVRKMQMGSQLSLL